MSGLARSASLRSTCHRGLHSAESSPTTVVRQAAIQQSVADLLDDFRTCFKRPGFTSFVTMVVGWIVCSGRHSICRVI
jgi:hypothetical protein